MTPTQRARAARSWVAAAASETYWRLLYWALDKLGRDCTHTIRWTCRHCGLRHVWEWPWFEAHDPGKINMRCDHCGRDTAGRMTLRGRFVANCARGHGVEGQR